jgi:hypothetical protein
LGIDSSVHPAGTLGQPTTSLSNAEIIGFTYNNSTFTIHTYYEIDANVFEKTIKGNTDNTVIVLSDQYRLERNTFKNCVITGSLSGQSHIDITIDNSGLTSHYNVFENCIISNFQKFNGRVKNSGLNGTITFPSSGETLFNGCHASAENSIPVIFDYSGVTNAKTELRGYTGTIQIDNMTCSACTVTIDLYSGLVILSASNILGNINIRGNGTVIDGTGDNVNLDVSGFVNAVNLSDIAKVHGLDKEKTVIVSKTGRTVDGISQTFEQIGDTVKITRNT